MDRQLAKNLIGQLVKNMAMKCLVMKQMLNSMCI